MASLSAVARIAYLASDVIIDSQPALPAKSAFSETFNALAKTASHRAKLIFVPQGGDPGQTILQSRNANLTSYTGSSNSTVLTRLVLHLAEISSAPVVLHLSIRDDLADVLLLRSAVSFFLVSSTPQQAHDNALLASRLARMEKKAVVHAFYADDTEGGIEEIAEERIQPFLVEEGHNLPNGVNGHVLPPNPTDHALGEAFKAFESASISTQTLTGRSQPPLVQSGANEPHTVLFTLGRADISSSVDGVSLVSVSLLNPLPTSRILTLIPPSVHTWSMKWTPLYLDVISAVQLREHQPVVQTGYLSPSTSTTAAEITQLIEDAASPSSARLTLGAAPVTSESSSLQVPHVPSHEASYTKILAHLFSDRLEVANSPSLVPSQGAHATSPEFALGRVRGQFERRAELVSAVQDLLAEPSIEKDLHSLLTNWILAKDDPVKSRALGTQITDKLSSASVSLPAVAKIVSLQVHFPSMSRWIIGSDAWAYDLGSSGLHHAIASGLNVNILILDTLPYSERQSADPARRKRDIGLYAMSHGDTYVASVAVYSSYGQVLQSLAEADSFQGTSVVVAYLPYTSEASPALEVLKETKMAVDAGYWPLYRWDPRKEKAGKEPFSLDSDAVKNDLQQFLDRQNHLSQLVRSKPEYATELVSSLGKNLQDARQQRAQQAYNDLLTAIDAPPVLILYASDGGAAEKKAKRLANRAKARGLTATLATLDSLPLDTLAEEEHVVFITSTAGQGEPPQNGRTFFKSLNAAVARNEANKPLGKIRYTVFAIGDSHYWPRPEDAHYYNKPGKDLDSRLAQLGGERIVDLGLGDDQDADGPETGYKVWEPSLWKALGVDSVEVLEAEPEPITNEHIKAASGYLRGTIAEGLQDTTTGALAPSDGQLTKFHGIYQQDDRDIRDERQAAGAEPAYSFMIRVRMPGGVCTPEQWLQMDQIADEHGSGTFKITTRQTFQFHGVIKRHLKPSIQAINRALLDTLAACGDVNRNVICSAIPTLSKLHEQVYEFSKAVSEHLLPRTTAYHEIWLDKKLVAGEAVKDFEPLYGEFYLPRKFKVAVAVPPTNDVDVYANDLGFIAIVDPASGELAGFNVTIGGGMGVTHGNKKTYPRLGNCIGFCTVEQGPVVAEKIMLVQRDNGNRADRKNARLKYTIDRMGLDAYKTAVETLLGYSLAPERPFSFDRNVDDYGWVQGQNGNHHFTMFVENGRIQDEPGKEFKSGLAELARVHKGTFRLTANQHLIVADVPDQNLAEVKTILKRWNMDNLSQTGLRLSSSACVAFPTCGLAMAESERYLPILVDKVESICEESGLRNDSIVMRMTGCPNGCARPYVAEVAFVGKAPGTYSMLLGGGYYGQRLNKIYRETVTEPEILAILKPMIKRYALERLDGEKFGDFVIRAGYIAATTEGKAWYDAMGGEGEHKETSSV
ncbi:hypothetical protein HWV62_14746 [Athelia sp. TMB]|nr:hypothetical protein HWV62_14746 [Athelia sp. TMB]